jgi:alanine racemase
MSRPIFCQVSIAALQHNLQVAKRKAGAHKVWAVIKANAYGHGTAAAVQGFESADGLAMLDFSDAVLCRQLGWKKPILMLEGAFAPQDVQLALAQHLELIVHSHYQLEWLIKASPNRQASLPLKIKVNTGMNRLGFAPQDVQAVLQTVKDAKLSNQVTLVTHFANSDMSVADGLERPMVTPEQQLQAFVSAGGDLIAGSLTNSAAVLTEIQISHVLKAETQSEQGWMRPGIMLYGATPFGHRGAAQEGLKPAMVFGSKLIAVQHLKAGDQVGYGSRFTADKVMRIGIVACGYADGYPRHAPSGTPIAVNGQRTVTVGRVSMDMLMVDLTALPEADIGAAVQMWGDIVSVDEVAAAAGTIGYELLCAIATRVNRTVVN